MANPLQAAADPCPNCNSQKTLRVFEKNAFGKIWYLAKCPECHQQYTDPLPNLDEIKGFYANFHDHIRTVDKTVEIFGPKTNAYVDWICASMQPGRSLDLGCSTGLFPYLLKQKGFAAEGLELNAESAEFGRQSFGLDIKSEPFETADYPANSFDLVSLCDVLEHSLNPIHTLARVHSLVKDGGFAFITFPDIESLESHYFKALAALTGRKWLWWHCNVPLHTWEFTKSTAEALFRREGFKVVGFRRTYLEDFDERSGLLSLLYLPAKLLSTPSLARRFGTQMEFLLKKE